jgi:hypothetical protein
MLAPLVDYVDLGKWPRSGDIKAVLEIPPGCGRDIERNRPTSVAAWVERRDAVSRRQFAVICRECISST